MLSLFFSLYGLLVLCFLPSSLLTCSSNTHKYACFRPLQNQQDNERIKIHTKKKRYSFSSRLKEAQQEALETKKNIEAEKRSLIYFRAENLHQRTLKLLTTQQKKEDTQLLQDTPHTRFSGKNREIIENQKKSHQKINRPAPSFTVQPTEIAITNKILVSLHRKACEHAARTVLRKNA